MNIFNKFKDIFRLRKDLNNCKNQIEESYRKLAKLIQSYKYGELNKGKFVRLSDIEIKVFSQNGEDGIILEIMKSLNKVFGRIVEIGIEDGTECNSANLLINFGWKGLLIEGNKDYARKARDYYTEKLQLPENVKVVEEFVSTKNFSDILISNDYQRNIDILSIDVDGVDYWLWESLEESIRPQLVVIEYNAYLPIEMTITVPNDEKFQRYKKHPSGFYFGASLSAMEKLGRAKGYSLVGCDSKGVNAFFVADEALGNRFEVLTAKDAYFPLTSGAKIRPTPEKAYSIIKNMPFIEV
jgi:hypothetical protein